jgi:hypothetical protein
MTKKLFALAFVPFLLVSCKGGKANEEEGALKILCPSGAPSLAFYDQGNNPNFETKKQPNLVLAELQKNDYDIIVFDSITALKTIKSHEEENGVNYRLAKIITGGNFHLVCINKEKDESGNYPLPGAGDRVVSFGEGLIPDLVYTKLASDYWHIDNTPYRYVSNVNEAQAVLKSGTIGGDPVDYVFIAEPALTAAETDSEAPTFGKVGRVRNIRADWKAYSDQDGLAQAGIMVNAKAIEKKPNTLKAFMEELDKRLNVTILDPNVAAASLDVFGDLDAQQDKFGFKSPLVKKLQGNGINGFGMVSPSETINVNAFLTSLGQPTFEDKYFVNI